MLHEVFKPFLRLLEGVSLTELTFPSGFGVSDPVTTETGRGYVLAKRVDLSDGSTLIRVPTGAKVAVTVTTPSDNSVVVRVNDFREHRSHRGGVEIFFDSQQIENLTEPTEKNVGSTKNIRLDYKGPVLPNEGFPKTQGHDLTKK